MSAKNDRESETVENDAQPADSSITQALAAVQKAMEELAAVLGADSTATISALKQAGQAASENLAGLTDDARDLGRAGLDEISESVRRNPLAWLAAAVGLGLVIGLWRNRGSRS
ncbi:hypothetical protein [Rhodoblastus sp.]|jgi:ElaB/YqjD/DUF883 family membrane-anchored ribosome-binding protein|uniref:hypothetical protein n=1 Tax=Rhodoblastus sp. TaxID=1962975 RepID=UPI0026142D0B|nr:hypothetical protein [Rhodoblastus sp.]